MLWLDPCLPTLQTIPAVGTSRLCYGKPHSSNRALRIRTDPPSTNLFCGDTPAAIGSGFVAKEWLISAIQENISQRKMNCLDWSGPFYLHTQDGLAANHSGDEIVLDMIAGWARDAILRNNFKLLRRMPTHFLGLRGSEKQSIDKSAFFYFLSGLHPCGFPGWR